MEKKIWSSFFAAVALMCTFVFASCVDDTDENELGNSSREVVNKPGNPDLVFVPIIDNEPVDSADVTTTVYNTPYEYAITADICAAEYDYVIERKYKDLNYNFCNSGDSKTLAGLNSETVLGDFAAEDGNVYTVTVHAPVLGLYEGVQRPYWKVRDINITSLRNYAENGDTLYTEVQALVNFTSVGVEPAKQAALTLKDSVMRVMVAEADRITGHRYDWYREVKSPTTEEIQVVKTNKWKSGKETAEPTFVQLLPLGIGTITLGTQETNNFGVFNTSNPRLQNGTEVNSTDVQLSTNFSLLKKRVDEYTSTVSNANGNGFYPKYTLTHYGVTFNDGDTVIVFPVIDWAVSEAGNVLGNATTGSVANAEYRTLTNNIRATYLEYGQDANETGTLYKRGDEVTDEGWNTANCWLKVEGKNVIVHGEWVTKHSLSDDVVTKFDSTFVRALSANTWEIYTKSKDNTTGANAITSLNSAKSKGWWSWMVVTNKVTENVTFATGNKQNIFTGTEYSNIALTYKGKKLAFKNYSYEYSEGSVTGPTANGSNDDYDVFTQNTKVNATASGNQTISATAKGTIYVEKDDVPPFFPSEYGKFEGAKFSATVDPVDRNQWYYGCAVRFEKGTLAVPINRKGEPQWNEATWWSGVKDNALNGAYYVTKYGKWYPCIASDQNGHMEWSLCSAQGSYCLYMLDYAGADTYGDWNNNDLNSKGQHTVLTDRLKMENNSSKNTMTLYYNGVNKGSWKYSN